MSAEITDTDVERFCYGSCYQLAEVISERTGWPVYAFWDDHYGDYDIHAFIRTPRGTYLDILGEHNSREMKVGWDAYGLTIRKVRKSYNFRSWDIFNPFYDSSDRARELLPALLYPFRGCEVKAA